MHDEEMAIACTAIVFGTPMLIIVASIFIKGLVRVVCHSRDVSLKIRLAERGMSAPEIEQIVRAGRFDEPSRQKASSTSQIPNALPVEGKPPKTEFAVRI